MTPSAVLTHTSNSSSEGAGHFTPALIIVDFQEDFCPPSGSLAVAGGRDIAPAINTLLSFPGFAARVATRDFHPRDHISFASNHPPPNNKPYETEITIQNPENEQESQTTRLWPDHCIQGTKGAELVPELDTSKIDHVIKKGQDKRIEMYSAFAGPFSNPQVSNSGLAQILRDKGVTHVFCVGLALDYCVKCTAVDAAKEGFKSLVIEDACRPVVAGEEARNALVKVLEQNKVKLVSMDSEEVQDVRKMASS